MLDQTEVPTEGLGLISGQDLRNRNGMGDAIENLEKSIKVILQALL
jgi:hypothetical protein